MFVAMIVVGMRSVFSASLRSSVCVADLLVLFVTSGRGNVGMFVKSVIRWSCRQHSVFPGRHVLHGKRMRL